MAAIGLGTLWNWWIHEISALIPKRVKWSFGGYPEARLLRFSDDETGIIGKRGDLVAPYSLLETGQDIPTKLKRRQIVDVIWPARACLQRNFSVPKVRPAQVRDVLALDLERATPFTQADVYWSYIARPQQDNKLEIGQFIVRRGDLDAFADKADALGLSIRNVFIEGCETQGPVVSNASQLARPARVWRMVNILLVAIIIGLACWQFYAPHQQRRGALSSTSLRVAALTEQAVALRHDLESDQANKAEKDSFIRMLVDRPLLVDAMRELTVQLPDTVWVNTLTFRPESMVFAGTVKGSAAELVLHLAQSEGLADARLSGPVSKAQDGISERFEIAVTPGNVGQ